MRILAKVSRKKLYTQKGRFASLHEGNMDAQTHYSSKKSDTEEWLQEAVTLSLYYDFYGELLNPRHRQIFEDYILNDFSLGEISEETGLSRQGVYDIVKRSSRKLHEYEEKLHLVGRFQSTRAQVTAIRDAALRLLEPEAAGELPALAEEIRAASEQVLKEL